jgi:hypothetical protein
MTVLYRRVKAPVPLMLCQYLCFANIRKPAIAAKVVILGIPRLFRQNEGKIVLTLPLWLNRFNPPINPQKPLQ